MYSAQGTEIQPLFCSVLGSGMLATPAAQGASDPAEDTAHPTDLRADGGAHTGEDERPQRRPDPRAGDPPTGDRLALGDHLQDVRDDTLDVREQVVGFLDAGLARAQHER